MNFMDESNVENNEPMVYTVKDIQRIFGCGKRQAYELMNSKTFPSFKINSKHYVFKDKFIEWLEKQSGKDIKI